MPDDGEVAGLFALILLADARREARSDDDGVPVPLDQQDRDRWDRVAIAEGTALLTATMDRHLHSAAGRDRRLPDPRRGAAAVVVGALPGTPATSRR